MPVLNAAPRAIEDTPSGTKNDPGRGILRIVRQGPRSIVSRAFASSPLKLLMPRNHGPAAWVYTSSYGGGLVDGDALHLDLRIGRGAMGFLSTQASTKVYRSPRGCSAEGTYHVDAGGALVVVPDPIMCFAQSTYRQQQHFEISGDAGLVAVDWISSGRRAAGERWAFDRYSTHTTIIVDERIVLRDALLLAASDGSIGDRLERFNVICAIVVAGARVAAYAERLLSAVAQTPISVRSDLIVGASPVGDDGAILRIAGVSTERVGLALREYLSFVPPLLGDDPWARKW
jgi:urease accessory protein